MRKIIILLLMVPLLFSCKKYEQPELGTRSVAIIEKGGLQFKDLNKNGKLDKYEDWRLSPEQRAADLLSKMDIDEKIGFMIISQINMGPQGTAELNERDQVTNRNNFTGEAADESINVSGTTKGIMERHLRHFILRANAPARIMAEWANNVQAVAENSRLGIPAIFASNPRNHVAVDNSLGLNVGNSYFTQWPGTLGLGATNDPELIYEFAKSAAAEWAACGIRKGYMYQLDLSTEPRWSRIEGTFGEDADRVAAIATQLVRGFQGEKMGPGSVALTMKHFPGGGPELKGWDSHYSYGKNLVYPGGMFDYHIKPFKAAVDAGVSGIMPYYARPHETQYEEVGSAFNYGLLTDLLRNTLGFKGLVNSDTGPINNMPWGVEDLTYQERYAKAVAAGTDLFSGGADVKNLKATYDAGMITDEQINTAVTRLLIEKFELGLFENPYVDPDKAEATANCEEFRAMAETAFRKSIVLMRNDEKVLPLKKGVKLYVERVDAGGAHAAVQVPENKWDVEFVDSPAKADAVVFWVFPGTAGRGGGFLGGAAGDAPISNLLSANNIDVRYINATAARKPVVVAVNCSKPWVLSELQGGAAKTWVATFGTTLPALMDVVTGKFNPVGKMPFGMPSSQEAVENNKEDVPSFQEAEGYALIPCGAGLSY
jgi:beta-glucosidase